MRHLESLLQWFEAVTAKPIDDATWRRWRKRLLRWMVIVLVIFTIQTMIVQNPKFLINALYHSRQGHFLQIQALSSADRAKLLQRLCLEWKYFSAGEADPYQIPGYHDCTTAATR